MVDYLLEVADPQAHLYRVTLELAQPAALQRLSLPVWIPGSYMVREFARHLSGLEARQGGRRLEVEQLDKCSWLVRCGSRGALRLSYLVYAFDASVRAAWLDADRGFFNGTSLFLRAEGHEQAPQRLRIGRLPRGWDVATSMPNRGSREFEAADYDELVDHPFELGRFWRGGFEVRGVPHAFVVAGAWPNFDGALLLADSQHICEAAMRLWHGRQGKPPFARYLFMLNAVDDGYGGLEHRDSTALIAARRDLPRQGRAPGDAYATLQGLISHEYFHAWNVKRLKPSELARIDYTRENHTELLWFFEGFTSYYDDLLLRRAGLIDDARYLKLLGKTLAAVQATPGRRVQSVAQASFDAWTKYYRSDENTPNSTISYYAKGSLVALALDLSLRTQPARSSLDAVMRSLWQGSGGGAIDEAAILAAVRSLGSRALAEQLDGWIHGTADLPLAPLLARAGVALRSEALGTAAALGLRLAEPPAGGQGAIQVRSVLRGSVAERAGLAAGDELIAADGWRLRRFDDLAQWVAPGAPLQLLLARDQRLRTLVLRPDAKPQQAPQLVLQDKPGAAQAAVRRAWLGGG